MFKFCCVNLSGRSQDVVERRKPTLLQRAAFSRVDDFDADGACGLVPACKARNEFALIDLGIAGRALVLVVAVLPVLPASRRARSPGHPSSPPAGAAARTSRNP